MRAFIALTLPSDVQSALASLQHVLRAPGADVKWVEPPQLHVTMKFLGEITEEQRRDVEGLLGRVASSEAPFLLGLQGAGAFPSVTSPRVLWAGIGAGKDAVLRLAGAIEQEGAGVVPSEERPFAAHVTIGRVRSPTHLRELSQALQEAAWTPPAPCRIAALTLYRSVLGSSGPAYTVLNEFPLAGG